MVLLWIPSRRKHHPHPGLPLEGEGENYVDASIWIMFGMPLPCMYGSRPISVQ